MRMELPPLSTFLPISGTAPPLFGRSAGLILLDGSSYDTVEDEDNDEMAAMIAGMARRDGVPPEVWVGWPADLGVRCLQNKEVIVDGERGLVSAIN